MAAVHILPVRQIFTGVRAEVRRAAGRLLVLVGVGVLVSASGALAQEGSAEAFRAAGPTEQRVALEAVGRGTGDGAAAAAMLRAALESGDAPVQTAALEAAARRVARVRASGTGAGAAARRAERQALGAVRPLIVQAVQHAEAEVRRAAITALANLDTADAPGGTERLSPAVTAQLVAAVATEPDAGVRLAIVRALAVSAEGTVAVRQVLEQAAGDPDPALQQYGALGLARLDPPRWSVAPSRSSS